MNFSLGLHRVTKTIRQAIIVTLVSVLMAVGLAGISSPVYADEAELSVTLAPPAGLLEAVTVSATVTGKPGETGTVLFEVIDDTGLLVNGAMSQFTIPASGTITVSELVSQDNPAPHFTFVAKVMDDEGNVTGESKQIATVLDSKIYGTTPASGPDTVPQVRYSGADRIETAVSIAKSMYPSGTKGVILASAENFADATAAATLAAKKSYPVLLTYRDTLAPATFQEIGRLMPHGGEMYVMGGEAAINSTVQNTIAKNYPTITMTRLSGATRVETAIAVASEITANQTPKTMVIVDANDWQSAVIASPLVAKLGEQNGVLLLSQNGKLTPSAQTFLAAHPHSPVLIIGTIDNAIANSQVEGRTVTRIVNNDATQRSLEVASTYFNKTKTLGFASRNSFPDGIAGSAAVTTWNAPLILLDPQQAMPQLATMYNKNVEIKVFGGQKALPEDIVSHSLLGL